MHIVICLVCTNVHGHAIRCMLTDGEMDDVWCTSVRRLVRREKRFCTKSRKAGTVLASLSLGSTRLQRNPGQQERQRFLGSAHPTRHRLRKGGGKITEERFLWRVSGSFHRVLTCWDFRTPCVRARLRREISTQRPSRSVCEHHSLCACCLCMLFPHVHGLHSGDGSQTIHSRSFVVTGV